MIHLRLEEIPDEGEAFGERCPHRLDMTVRICAECNWLAVGGEFGREFQSQRCRHHLVRQPLSEEHWPVVPGRRDLQHAASSSQHRGIVEGPVHQIADRDVAKARCHVLVAVGFGSGQGIRAAWCQVAIDVEIGSRRPESGQEVRDEHGTAGQWQAGKSGPTSGARFSRLDGAPVATAPR